jgi:hypothetical protein
VHPFTPSTGVQLAELSPASPQGQQDFFNGQLGQQGVVQSLSDLKIGLHRKLNEASEKASSGSRLVVFIDLNLPPEFANSVDQSWIDELRVEVGNFIISRGGIWPFSLAVITNCPHHYGSFAQPDPLRWFYFLEPDINWQEQEMVTNCLAQALKQYGNIPQLFPEKP